MKNYYLLLILLVSLLSCSEDNIYVDSPQEKANSTLKQASDGVHDLLGFSYDVTKEYLNVKSAPRTVLDIDAFKRDNPTRYYNPSTTGGDSETYAGATATDMLEEIKTKNKVSTSASYAPFGGSIKVESEMDVKQAFSTKYSYARHDVIKKSRNLYLNADLNMLLKYVHPVFYEDLNKSTPDKFVEDYGTHVLTDITIGGRLSFLYRSTIIEESSSIRKKQIVEAGVKFGVGAFGADANNSHENESIKSLNKKNSTWKIWVNYHGGEQSGQSFTFDSEKGLSTSTFNPSAWEASVNNNNAALVDINWEKAYPIYEFITDPVKKAQIKAAVEKYIAKEKVDVMELSPLYEYWQAGVNDHYYNTEYASTLGGGLWKYNNVVVGYIYNKSINGASPLYEYWDAKGNDHYYNMQYASTMGGGAWKYNGIVGYIFKSKVAGTTPLHEYWNPGAHDHYYSTEYDSSMGGGAWKYNGIVGYLYSKK